MSVKRNTRRVVNPAENNATAETIKKKRKLSKSKKRQLRKVCVIFALYLIISSVITVYAFTKCEQATADNTYVIETKINSARWVCAKHGHDLILSTDAGDYYYIPYDWPFFMSSSANREMHSEMLQTIQGLISESETVYITVRGEYIIQDLGRNEQEAVELKTDSRVIYTPEAYNNNQELSKIIVISVAVIVLIFGIFRTWLDLRLAGII